MKNNPKTISRTDAIDLLRAGPLGIARWNELRASECKLPDLRSIDLSGTFLHGENNPGPNFSNIDLGETSFENALVDGANFVGATMKKVKLFRATFSNTVISGVDLSSMALGLTSFYRCDLKGVNLKHSFLGGTILEECDLTGTDFTKAILGKARIASDVSRCVGLEQISFTAESMVDINHCLLAATHDLPVSFLKSCGLRDEEIAYFRSQIGKPIRFYECFISYSNADEDFATRLYNDLQGAGIRCWKWNEDARTGKNLWGEIDHAIRRFDKLVIIASKDSLKSPLVCDEIERAICKERELEAKKFKGEYSGETDVLFPVRLDDYIFDGWKHERKVDVTKKFIADARGWDKDNAIYKRILDRVIRDLKK